MKIHTLQTGTVQIKTRQRAGQGEGMMRLVNTLRDPNWTEPLPIYAWAIEHPDGIIVVDTGETARAAEPGYFPRWHPFFRLGIRAHVMPQDEIGPQLRKIGIAPDDVRWVVMTHLHTDHAGGLHHFPHAEILVSRTEYESASGFGGRMSGYLPQHWPSWFAPQLVDFTDGAVGRFAHSHTLTDGIHLVPTPGHAPGQLSIIVEDGPANVFIAGDVSYTQQYLLDQVVDGVSPDPQQAAQTMATTLAYVQSQPTVYLPSHDPDSARRLHQREIVPTNAQEMEGVYA